MKLEPRNIVPYLPYNLEGINDGGTLFRLKNISVNELGEIRVTWSIHGGTLIKGFEIKPILRPLVDFYLSPKKWEGIYDEFSEYDFEAFGNSFFNLGVRTNNCMYRLNYTQFELLCRHHFDVFGLIDKGLAIDINTL